MCKKPYLSQLYFTLALCGLVATWYYNAQYLMGGGSLQAGAFFGAAFANTLTTAITIDVYISALVFAIWVHTDAKYNKLKWSWLYVVLCFAVGLAFAFPLYLGMRECARHSLPKND